jgi:MFS family permease
MKVVERQPSPAQWVALLLLVLSVCINYVDRGNLGVAATSIQRDLHFRPDQLGILLGAFFWTYSILQFAAANVIERWNVHWVYAIGFFAWSAATGITGLTGSFLTILLLRFILGAGESVAYPAYSKIFATDFPESLRGTANGLIDAGSKVGPALGVLLGVKMIHWLSWRYMFVAIGFASMLWLIPWCLLVPKLKSERVVRSRDWSPSYGQLARTRAVWGTVLGLFGANYTWYFFLTWLPYYFETERHYTHDRLAFFGSLPFWTTAASSTICGLLADALIRRGFNAGRVRQLFVSLGLTGCCGFMLPAVLVADPTLSNVLFALTCVCMGAFSSNHWAFTQTLAGPRAAGKWTGFENCAGNLAGVVAPYVTGVALAVTHKFFAAFAIACCVLMVGVLGFWAVVGKPVPVDWKFAPAEPYPEPSTT